MIRNRFSILMAERELTAAKVSAETGISRSTLSTLVNNSGDGVQFKTLDKLCNYLEISPSDFFDYSPFILDYNLNVSDFRGDILSDTETYRQQLLALENDDDRINYLMIDHLDIFGDARYEIEISAQRGQKRFKYLMCIDIYPNEDLQDSNAPKQFDVVCFLRDQYGEKSFVNEVYNQVSITFQTQIRNECFKLVKDSLQDIVDYATIKDRDIKIYIQTPFGDTEAVSNPESKNLEKIQRKYGDLIISKWMEF